MKMRGALLLVLAAVVAVGLAAATAPHVTVRTDAVTVTSSGDVSVTVEEPASAPVSSTPAPSPGPHKPGSPLFRYAVYAVTGVAAAYVFQWVKRKFFLSGKRAITAAAILCAALGAGTTALFKDGSVSAIVSNPWNIAGAAGTAFSFAQLAYKLWVK